MTLHKPMVTQTYYVNKILKSQSPTEFYKNTLFFVAFVQQKMIQAVEFNDYTLLTKSL